MKELAIAVLEERRPTDKWHALIFGDYFGESLGGSQAPPSFWKVIGLPRKFPASPARRLPNAPKR